MSNLMVVRAEIFTCRYMEACRKVDIEYLDGYAELLCNYGNAVLIYTLDEKEMNETRLKAVNNMFNQCQKGTTIPAHALFDPDVEDVSEIYDDERY